MKNNVNFVMNPVKPAAAISPLNAPTATMEQSFASTLLVDKSVTTITIPIQS